MLWEMVGGEGKSDMQKSTYAKSCRMDYLCKAGTVCIILLSNTINLNNFYTNKAALYVCVCVYIYIKKSK
jgi:hypothetical protein